MTEENLTPAGDGEPFSYDPLANPRDSVEDEMAAKRRQQLQDLPTLDGLNQQAGEDPLATEDDGSDDQPAEAAEESPPRDDKGRFAPTDSKPEVHEGSSGEEARKLKLKIDGREEELSEAEVIALAQKGRAADRRFQDAAAMMRQAQELATQHRPQPEQQKPEQPSTPETGDDDLVKALMYGSEAEVRTALSQLRQPQQPQQQIDPVQIARTAAEMAAERSEYQNALTTALDEYPEVKTDVRLQEVATSFALDELKSDLIGLGYTEQMLKMAPQAQWWERHREARKAGYSVRGYRDLFKAAGEATRAWRQGGQPPASDGLAEKADRKAQAAPQPRAAHAATPARTESKPKTQAQLIAEERKSRGLA